MEGFEIVDEGAVEGEGVGGALEGGGGCGEL